MLLQSKQLAGGRIMSLHTGQSVGRLAKPIINPHKLEIVGYYCERANRKDEQSVLLAKDIRDASAGKVLIDSADEITPVGQLIRLQEFIELKFELLDKPVKTVAKRRLGKVDEYIVDTMNFVVQKLYVKQSLFRSFNLQTLVIDRQQIVEVSDRQVTVNETLMAEPAVAPPVTPA